MRVFPRPGVESKKEELEERKPRLAQNASAAGFPQSLPNVLHASNLSPFQTGFAKTRFLETSPVQFMKRNPVQFAPLHTWLVPLTRVVPTPRSAANPAAVVNRRRWQKLSAAAFPQLLAQVRHQSSRSSNQRG
jgi:hypothetical protein